MSGFAKFFSKAAAGLASKLSINKLFDALDVKSLIKNSVVSAVKVVEQSFVDAALEQSPKTDPDTVEKMKNAAAFALAIAQLRQKGGAAKIAALFAKSAVKAAVDEVKHRGETL